MIAEFQTTAAAAPTEDAPDVLTVAGVRRRPAFGPAYVELAGPDGAGVTVKLGSAAAAERLREACDRYLEFAAWDG